MIDFLSIPPLNIFIRFFLEFIWIFENKLVLIAAPPLFYTKCVTFFEILLLNFPQTWNTESQYGAVTFMISIHVNVTITTGLILNPPPPPKTPNQKIWKILANNLTPNRNCARSARKKKIFFSVLQGEIAKKVVKNGQFGNPKFWQITLPRNRDLGNFGKYYNHEIKIWPNFSLRGGGY